ncbi:L,D-transpeptidase [Zhengella sp. ZM62]|uniref:L,D-transpeptidase n=1 Tax=Zhengella sedimenti TaxID=3390035 RepID=UPI0039756B13
MNRRSLLAGLTAMLAMPAAAQAHQAKQRKSFTLDPRFEPRMVEFSGHEPGTIVIDTANHFLYLVTGDGEARRYGVGVGRAGLAFKGSAVVGRKAKWPAWRPTDNMIRRNPRRYARYARGVPGGPGNPLGARALYLYRGERDTMFRIHGTTEPSSIGRSVSNGCIRMINEHVEDLYERVPVGTRVVVM